jgi:hypothetical protein
VTSTNTSLAQVPIPPRVVATPPVPVIAALAATPSVAASPPYRVVLDDVVMLQEGHHHVRGAFQGVRQSLGTLSPERTSEFAQDEGPLVCTTRDA